MDDAYLAIQVVMMPRDTNPFGTTKGHVSCNSIVRKNCVEQWAGAVFVHTGSKGDMRRKRTTWVIVVVGLAIVLPAATPLQKLTDKCSMPKLAQETLVNAERIELFSLDPSESDPRADEDSVANAKAAKDRFYGVPVLGRLKVSDENVRRKLVKTVVDGVNESMYGEQALCFIPRHGIRATSGDFTVELVICFECQRLKGVVFRGDASGNDARERWASAIKETSQKYLDEILTAAKVPLPPKPREQSEDKK
jgi:hypothetical protein